VLPNNSAGMLTPTMTARRMSTQWNLKMRWAASFRSTVAVLSHRAPLS
jgi:hypothetical protein